LSAIMMQYMAQFARTGHPGKAGGVTWEPWSKTDGGPRRIVFDADADQAIVKMSKN